MALDGSLGGRGQTSDEIVGAIRSAGVPDARFFSHGLTSSVTLGNLGLWPGLKWAPATGQEGTGARMRSAAEPPARLTRLIRVARLSHGWGHLAPACLKASPTGLALARAFCNAPSILCNGEREGLAKKRRVRQKPDAHSAGHQIQRADLPVVLPGQSHGIAKPDRMSTQTRSCGQFYRYCAGAFQRCDGRACCRG